MQCHLTPGNNFSSIKTFITKWIMTIEESIHVTFYDLTPFVVEVEVVDCVGNLKKNR